MKISSIRVISIPIELSKQQIEKNHFPDIGKMVFDYNILNFNYLYFRNLYFLY